MAFKFNSTKEHNYAEIGSLLGMVIGFGVACGMLMLSDSVLFLPKTLEALVFVASLAVCTALGGLIGYAIQNISWVSKGYDAFQDETSVDMGASKLELEIPHPDANPEFTPGRNSLTAEQMVIAANDGKFTPDSSNRPM